MAPELGDSFSKALSLAHSLHKSQFRKGSSIPYISHLLAVCAYVLEDGGTEQEAIAALLHDAVEDQGGMETLETIRNTFGQEVTEMVADCSDAYRHPKPDWLQRKISFLDRLPSVSHGSLRIITADKLHNLQSIHYDYRNVGEQLWSRFKGGRNGTLWYYERLFWFFSAQDQTNLIHRFMMEYQALMDLIPGDPGHHDPD